MEADLPGLKTALDNAKEAREQLATNIKDEANVCVEKYRPQQGPPTFPEVPTGDATTTCNKTSIEWGDLLTTFN